MKKYLYFVFLLLVTVSLRADDNVVLKWNEAALTAIRQTKTPPPIAARALAILHTSIFDAWAAYDANAIGTTRGDTLRRPADEFTDANKAKATSFAAYRVLVDLFPTKVDNFDALMASLGYDPLDTSTSPLTAVGIGNIVSADIIAFRHRDGSNQLADEVGTIGGPYSDYTGYVPVNTPTSLNDPNRWQPLIVNDVAQTFLTPQWGLVKPFALISGSQFLLDPPAQYPSRHYTKQAKELLVLSANLDDRTKSIAEYWADGSGTVTPPGHWNVIAQYVSHRDENTLDQDVKLFFALDNALFDSSIACWCNKRFYDYVRPISAIRFLFKGIKVEAWAGPGNGTQKIEGETWKPYIGTPPFAEYVSGHSTFSAAAAQVLKLFTRSCFYGGEVIIPAGSSTIEPGITPSHDVVLKWRTFISAANQAGFSRRLGGIHFKDGDLNARALGKIVGNIAFERAQFYINGQ